MSNPIGDPGHGHSPAAWTAVIIMLVAVAIGTLLLLPRHADLSSGSPAGIVVIGALVGWGMAKAGYGVNGSKYARKSIDTVLSERQ